MAISDLLPRKAAGSATRKQALHDRLGYDQKEEKTKGGAYVSSYMCSPETAAAEFETAKLLYEMSTGRSQPEGRDIIAYRILQSFAPGEITPEEANKLGYELAMKFTKGRHQFVVSTHIDKAHIHNHVEFNSTNLECDGKFKNFKNSSFALRELNDRICREHGYSVIEKPKAKGRRYKEKAAAKRGRSHKERLRQTIDRALPGCKSFEGFLDCMRAEGYEVKRRGKSLEFKNPEQERFTRSFRLGEDYTEEALRERIADPIHYTEKAEKARKPAEGKIRADGEPTARETDKIESSGKAKNSKDSKDRRPKTGTARRAAADRPEAEKANWQRADRNVSLLVDIEAKMRAGKGKGYERWAKVFNLKEAAKTLNFLTENGVTDYGELAARADAAGEKFNSLSVRARQLEGRMAETAQMKTHILNYSKTREIYREYRKSRHKEQFRAAHADAIAKHEAAKAAFDNLGGKQIPKVAELNKEYAALLAEKKACYEEYKAARKEMLDYKAALQNVNKLLGLEPQKQEQERQAQGKENHAWEQQNEAGKKRRETDR